MSIPKKNIPGETPLEEHDPVMFELIEQEKRRQWSGLELIASENLTSKAVMQCLGSCLVNKYAEGLPGKRYYGGTEFVDQVETLCNERALQAYRLNRRNGVSTLSLTLVPLPTLLFIQLFSSPMIASWVWIYLPVSGPLSLMEYFMRVYGHFACSNLGTLP